MRSTRLPLGCVMCSGKNDTRVSNSCNKEQKKLVCHTQEWPLLVYLVGSFTILGQKCAEIQTKISTEFLLIMLVHCHPNRSLELRK